MPPDGHTLWTDKIPGEELDQYISSYYLTVDVSYRSESESALSANYVFTYKESEVALNVSVPTSIYRKSETNVQLKTGTTKLSKDK